MSPGRFNETDEIKGDLIAESESLGVESEDLGKVKSFGIISSRLESERLSWLHFNSCKNTTRIICDLLIDMF